MGSIQDNINFFKQHGIMGVTSQEVADDGLSLTPSRNVVLNELNYILNLIYGQINFILLTRIGGASSMAWDSRSVGSWFDPI